MNFYISNFFKYNDYSVSYVETRQKLEDYAEKHIFFDFEEVKNAVENLKFEEVKLTVLNSDRQNSNFEVKTDEYIYNIEI